MTQRRDTSFDGMIPELPHWNDGQGIDVDDWIGAIGRHDHAIGYSRVFWPEFVLHDGCLLRAGFSPVSYAAFLEKADGDRRAVEAVMNHQHIADMLMGQFNNGEAVTREQVVYVGRVLKEMWAAKLARDFPELRVVVSFSEEDCDEILDYQITVYQES